MEINAVGDTPLPKDYLAHNNVCYFITVNCVSVEGTILLNSNYFSQTITNAVFITALRTLISLLIVDFSDHYGWSFRPGVQITTKLWLLIVQTCRAQEEFFFEIIFVELEWVVLMSWFESRQFYLTSSWVMLDDGVLKHHKLWENVDWNKERMSLYGPKESGPK